jgi:hypothetical protein
MTEVVMFAAVFKLGHIQDSLVLEDADGRAFVLD